MNATTTLAEVVAANAAAARVFDRLGLDYCCHGERTVLDAALAAGLDPDVVVAELVELAPSEQPWTQLDLPALADHVVEVHHAYLHEELPLLDALADKVMTVHGSRHPELIEVRRLVAEVRDDLEPHLAKEEEVVFPAIRALAGGRRDLPFGSFDHPIRVLIEEHESTGELLEQLRAVTGGYALPDDACASYQSLYQRLDHLEVDTHLHIHKENHILFPGALRLAEGAAAAPA